MNRKALSLLGMAFFACTSYAQEKTQDSLVGEQLETVVLDTKFKMNREKSGKVIYQISQEDLQKVKGQSLAQTINTVSGIEITGAKSNNGQNLAYRIRGGNNSQVVILIDGIQVNDPSTSSNDFDLRLLDINLIESIEIVKGGVSTLYGTGATSGVISITTKKVSDKNTEAVVYMNTGSNRTTETDKYKLNSATVGTNISGRLGKFNYLIGGSIENAKGMSSLRSQDDSLFEDDPFERNNAVVKLGYDFSKSFRLNGFANYNYFKNHYDNTGGFDGFNEATSKNIQFGINPEFKYNKGSIVLNTSITSTRKNSEKTSFPAKYESNSITADLYNKYKFTKYLWAVIGVNYQEFNMEQASIPWGETALVTSIEKEDTDVTLIDPYLNITYLSDFGLTVNAGARLNNHSNYGSHFVYNVNPSFNIKATDKINVKLLASGSTSFIAPSLYQQYDPTYGNTDLKPQESFSSEGGFELLYNNKYRISAIAFHREDESKIVWDVTGYTNEADDKIKTQGVELETSLPLHKSLNLTGNYTFLQHETDVLSRRNPKHKVNANLSYILKEKTSLSLAYQYTDVRKDVFFTPSFTTEDKVLKPYNLVNFFVNHQLTNQLEINASLVNVFDEEYTEIFGYSTKGRNYTLGLVLKF